MRINKKAAAIASGAALALTALTTTAAQASTQTTTGTAAQATTGRSWQAGAPGGTPTRRFSVDCQKTLMDYGYTVTTARKAACALASGVYMGTVTQSLKIAACFGALKITGVSFSVSGLACGRSGGLAGFVGEQWCTNNDNVCPNAWGGGPFVNAYTQGVELSDSHSEFDLMYNDATGYYELVYMGSGSWAGRCIGDAYNDSGLAYVSLDSCGTASGNQGWGTNLDIGTSGCPSGEAWFYDYRWNGYLGPIDNPGNGSHFYLNKPSPYCFQLWFINAV
jgi:hypothetical protein